MPYCVWKHYNQSASSQNDSLLTDGVSSRNDAIELAFDYLIANDNKADELGDIKLREQLDDEGGFDTGDYRIIILSSNDVSDSYSSYGFFILNQANASDVNARKVGYCDSEDFKSVHEKIRGSSSE